MRHGWRVEAPKHAVTHTFLMHEILAFSALHKAHKLRDQRTEYYAFGIHHQDLTIRGVRQRLQNVTAHDAAAMVATSTLLTLSVFASTGFEMNYPEIPNSQGAIEGILNIFNLMQGMGNVLALAQVHVFNSFLAPMFKDSPEVIPSQPMLQENINHIPNLISFIQTKTDLPEEERQCYLTIIGQFEEVLKVAMPPHVDNRELRFLFFWPLHLQADFLNYFRGRHAGALAIIMYYSTMLIAAQPRYWFMEGWGDQLMRACFEDLDKEWLPGVRWPVSFIHERPTWTVFNNLVQQKYGLPGQDEAPAIPAAFQSSAPVEVSYRQSTAGLTRSAHADAAYQQNTTALPSTQDHTANASSSTVLKSEKSD